MRVNVLLMQNPGVHFYRLNKINNINDLIVFIFCMLQYGK